VLYAFLDTTALHKAYQLQGSQWESISQAVDMGVARVVVCDVSLLELQRQIGPDAREVDKRLQAASADAARFGVEISTPPIDVDPAAWRTEFEQLLGARGIELLRHAEPPHALVLERDLAGRPPFKSTGEGYRDALIWITFIEWLEDIDADQSDSVMFVSGNTTQFASGKEGIALRDELREEAAAVTSATVQLAPKRSDLVDLARELSRQARELAREESSVPAAEPMPSTSALVEDRVREAVSRLDGAEFDVLGSIELDGIPLEFEVELPQVSEASIESAEPLEGRVDASHVDTFNETTSLTSLFTPVEAISLLQTFQAIGETFRAQRCWQSPRQQKSSLSPAGP
jgi:hypothetical protein